MDNNNTGRKAVGEYKERMCREGAKHSVKQPTRCQTKERGK